MNAGQYEGIIGRLDAIIGKMPAVPQLEDPVEEAPHPVHAGRSEHSSKPVRPVAPHSLAEEGAQAASLALTVFLGVLNDWIEGAKSNHYALGHRGENLGSECWVEWHPDDIRNMINDAARELGVAEPWKKDER